MTSLFENARFSVLQVAEEFCSALGSFFSLSNTGRYSDSTPTSPRDKDARVVLGQCGFNRLNVLHMTGTVLRECLGPASHAERIGSERGLRMATYFINDLANDALVVPFMNQILYRRSITAE